MNVTRHDFPVENRNYIGLDSDNTVPPQRISRHQGSLTSDWPDRYNETHVNSLEKAPRGTFVPLGVDTTSIDFKRNITRRVWRSE